MDLQFFVNGINSLVSPWHDIPLSSGDDIFNFIVEIPKESSAKMECDISSSVLSIYYHKSTTFRVQYPLLTYDNYPSFLDAIFIYNIHWNYGLLPQTWEDPYFANSKVEGALGDNDPVDVEISERQGKIGEVLKVKPLGALAMIDEGELDWKIVAISI
ncbi:Soluble inorganic pyrophosphatase [Vigna angularis]|uniref:inorganic diphosphatase n=1 Tax=Phaseolus angularis TaxID=3914 RepID=A0A8T0JKF6_PHAAN|nr:Soluble inorganic pyrophosphatase [Vigna angularis]